MVFKSQSATLWDFHDAIFIYKCKNFADSFIQIWNPIVFLFSIKLMNILEKWVAIGVLSRFLSTTIQKGVKMHNILWKMKISVYFWLTSIVVTTNYMLLHIKMTHWLCQKASYRWARKNVFSIKALRNLKNKTAIKM